MAVRQTKTISIKPELNAELAQFPDENWSAVACRAFEIRLQELQNMNTTAAEIDRTIARLRGSKLSRGGKMVSEGEEAGVRFVLEDAEFADLERVMKADEAADISTDNAWQLAMLITGNDEESATDLEKSLREGYGDSIDEIEWLQGFVKGIVKKYDEIRSKI